MAENLSRIKAHRFLKQLVTVLAVFYYTAKCAPIRIRPCITKEEIMKTLKRIFISIALLALPLSALADDDDDDCDHGRHHYKHYHKHYHKHYDKRHYGDHGYRPHVRRHEHHVYHHHHRHHDRRERVYVPAVVHAPVAYPHGVTIHGNVHLPF